MAGECGTTGGNNHRTFWHAFIVFTVLVIPSAAAADDRPNILWITAEDMSPTLGCYGDDYAGTPNIDRLATEGVRYTHVFATAPVCSPVRSTLITGCYATSLGTHNMRSAFPIPDQITGFPSYLRKAGYYTTNNAKTDYNTANAAKIIEASWDESSNTAHWRNRPDTSRPFFSVFNLMTSHQSRTMVWPYEKFVADVQSNLEADEIHDPETAPLPPYYPDSPIIRREWARYYDCVTAMDKEVGAILQQLEDDGLADETIVFFFSDHGSGMPRHKRALLDTGMHVPLLIRYPEKFRHLASNLPGETTDRLVSFIDFPPTVLAFAGLDAPDYMHGMVFCGPTQTLRRQYAFGHRDRVDEAFDTARSVRSKRYLYIRNFRPDLGYHQPSAWPDQGEIRQEINRLTDRESMTDAQWHLVQPARPLEELYDCDRDPMNLRNLATTSADGATRQILKQHRVVFLMQAEATEDFGFLPESQLSSSDILPVRIPALERRTGPALMAALRAKHDVGLMLIPDLRNGTVAQRYWAAVAARDVQDELDLVAAELLPVAKTDESPGVRVAAASTLVGHNKHARDALHVLSGALDDKDLNVVLHAMRNIELLGDQSAAVRPAVEKLAGRCQKILSQDTPATTATFVQTPEQDLAMFIGFSANAFLRQVAAQKPDE